MKKTLTEGERLKQRDLITRVFKKGKRYKNFPLVMVCLPLPTERVVQVGVSVPKRKFKKAVDRNHLKRLIRESYRKNKPGNLKKGYALFFIYTAKDILSYHQVERKLLSLLEKLD